MYGRRAKESHRDTVSYEIDMLAFCSRRLTEDEALERSEKDLHLEGFLLHYRNLVRFFSGRNHREDKGDLSTANSKAWAGRDLTPAEIAAIQQPAIALDEKYHEEISKYLQHCTRLRSEQDKVWDAPLMRREMATIIEEFERAFPR